jgi:hypothetical protein
LANWELFPLYGTALAVAYQQHELGDSFDQMVAQFDALRMPTRGLLPVGIGFFLYRAQARVEQFRAANGPERRRRQRQARTALRHVGRTSRTPMQRTQVALARAGYLQAAGRPQAALDLLSTLDAQRRAFDAPLLDFDAARIRALALRDLESGVAADEQTQIALAIADKQGWPKPVWQAVADVGPISATATGP